MGFFEYLHIVICRICIQNNVRACMIFIWHVHKTIIVLLRCLIKIGTMVFYEIDITVNILCICWSK